MQSPSIRNHLVSGKLSANHSGRITSGTTQPFKPHRQSGLSSRVSTSLYSSPIGGGASSSWSGFVRFLLMICGLSLIVLFITPFYSDSATMAEQSVLAKIDGGVVNVLHTDSQGIETLDDGDRIGISVNDMVSAVSGTAHLQFFSDQLVRVYPAAQITVERYEVNDLGKRLEYMVWSGQVMHESLQAAGPSDWIQISTPSSNASVRNAIISVEVVNATETIYSVDAGVAWITMDDQELFLAPNERLVAASGQPLIKQDALADSADPDSAIGYSESTAAVEPANASVVKTVGELLASPEQQLTQSNGTTWQLHTVQPGDSFWTIASKHAISMEALSQANPEITDSSILPVGRTVRIPISAN